MRRFVLAAVTVASLSVFGAAAAEPYVDYTPHKGLWHVTTMKVDPNHIDDYVTGMKGTWMTGEEIAKKRGLIDSYQIMVKMNPGAEGGNVLLIEHIPNTALLEPDQVRDQAMEKEVYAAMSKVKMDEAVKGFDKYRTFISEDYWSELSYNK